MEEREVHIPKTSEEKGGGAGNDIVDYFKKGRKRWRATSMSADEIMVLTRDWETPEKIADPPG